MLADVVGEQAIADAGGVIQSCALLSGQGAAVVIGPFRFDADALRIRKPSMDRQGMASHQPTPADRTEEMAQVPLLALQCLDDLPATDTIAGDHQWVVIGRGLKRFFLLGDLAGHLIANAGQVIGGDLVGEDLSPKGLSDLEFDLWSGVGHDENRSFAELPRGEGEAGGEVSRAVGGDGSISQRGCMFGHPSEGTIDLEGTDRRPAIVLDPDLSVRWQAEVTFQGKRTDQWDGGQVAVDDGARLEDIGGIGNAEIHGAVFRGKDQVASRSRHPSA